MDEFTTLTEIGDGAYRAMPMIEQDENDTYKNPKTLERWGDRKYSPLAHDFQHD